MRLFHVLSALLFLSYLRASISFVSCPIGSFLQPLKANPIHNLLRPIAQDVGRLQKRSPERGLSLAMMDVNAKPKHFESITAMAAASRTALELEQDEVWVDMDRILGSGTFGEVFEAVFVQGPRKGTRAVAKRAKTKAQPTYAHPLPNMGGTAAAQAHQAWQDWCKFVKDTAPTFLKVESYINSRCATMAQAVVAPYLGTVEHQGNQWLLWKHMGAAQTLENVLQACHDAKSMEPLARALGVQYEGGKPSELRRLVNEAARQLLECCSELQQAGIAHRDIKPENLIIAHHQMLLIDFGCAAVMGDAPMVGYNYSEAPGDCKYRPPEIYIDELEWTKYDIYCVALILLRILMPPFLGDPGFEHFRRGFREAGNDIDAWFERLILADPMIQTVQGKNRAELPNLGFPQRSERIREYERLAGMSCVMHYQNDRNAPPFSFCALKDGLAALSNDHVEGLVWNLLHAMLEPEPSLRPSAEEALRQLRRDAAGSRASDTLVDDQQPAPPGTWVAVKDKSTGDWYFWNRYTNETTMLGEPKPRGMYLRSEPASEADAVIAAYTAD